MYNYLYKKNNLYRVITYIINITIITLILTLYFSIIELIIIIDNDKYTKINVFL